MANKIIKGATALGGIALGIKGIKSLTGKKKAAADPVVETPAPAPVEPTMPVADDVAVQAAKKRSLIRQIGRGGRSSTILTDTSGSTLGG